MPLNFLLLQFCYTHSKFTGMYHSGIGPVQLNNLFTSMNLPNISESLIRRRCDEVGPVLEDLAEESTSKALCEEGHLSATSKHIWTFSNEHACTFSFDTVESKIFKSIKVNLGKYYITNYKLRPKKNYYSYIF